MPAQARAGVEAAFETGRRLEEYVERADASAETEATLRLAADSWRLIAAHLGGGSADQPWKQLSWRCRAGRRPANAREFVRLRRAVGRSAASAVWAGARLGRLAPGSALRTYALAACWSRQRPAWAVALRTHAHHVDDLTRGLGFGDGTLEERARAAYRAIAEGF
jgi:hypothetical protein